MCCQVSRWWCGSAYNVDDGSIPYRFLLSHLIECMNLHTVRSHRVGFNLRVDIVLWY